MLSLDITCSFDNEKGLFPVNGERVELDKVGELGQGLII